MNRNYKEIARLKREEVSQRKIGKRLGISRNTVDKVVNIMIKSGYSFHDFEQMSEAEARKILNNPTRERDPQYVLPDYDYLTKELSKPGVTLTLLWEEYQDECRLSKKQAYQLTQFKTYFHKHLRKTEFTDIIKHKAGDKIEVDWGGIKPRWQDPDTGETIYGYLFVGILPFSGYGFAKVYPNMKLQSWLLAHIDMFEYFGGASRILVPDNLKTGVTKNTKNELLLNRSYNDMASYYGTVVIPTRVYHPKDKASVESLVKQASTQIIGRMRNHQFFTMEEYNQQLRVELDKLNNKPFQKKKGSRYSVFYEMEKSSLIPLPHKAYDICEWRKAKVLSNAHISYGKCYYSVPYKYIGEKVDLKIGENRLDIYYEQEKVHTCELIQSEIGKYTTYTSHMPAKSNVYREWNSSRYLNWAKEKGPFTYRVIQLHFDRAKVEQQKYRMVHSILELASLYNDEKLEIACQNALEQNPCPNYKNIKIILENMQEVKQDEESDDEKAKPRFLRGGSYYE